MSRRICQFSCGAASAIATKLTLSKFPDSLIVNAYIQQEQSDNRRFLLDCETWFGQKIIVVHNEKYAGSTYEVWKRKQFIKGKNGAPCSLELKRSVLATVKAPGDIYVIGFTVEEIDRFHTLCERFPEETFEAPLIAANLNKSDCFALIDKAGIILPLMYRLGYSNANCVGCPKGGQNYWQKIRRDFPAQFAEIQQIQEDIGVGAGFLAFRSGPRKGERMMLKDLPAGDGNLPDEMEEFSCSYFCEEVKDLSS